MQRYWFKKMEENNNLFLESILCHIKETKEMIICDRCAKKGKIIIGKWTLRIYPAWHPEQCDYIIALCDDCTSEVKKFMRAKEK